MFDYTDPYSIIDTLIYFGYNEDDIWNYYDEYGYESLLSFYNSLVLD